MTPRCTIWCWYVYYTLGFETIIFTELLSETNRQANTIFSEIGFFCNGYEDHLTNGGCINRTDLTCPSQQGGRLHCYNSKNYEQWFVTQFVDNVFNN